MNNDNFDLRTCLIRSIAESIAIRSPVFKLLDSILAQCGDDAIPMDQECDLDLAVQVNPPMMR